MRIKVSKLMKTALVAVTLGTSTLSFSATFDLRLGDYHNLAPYMRELIKSSLEMDGHTVNLEVLSKSYKIRRIIKQVHQGKLKVLWTGRGREFPEKPDMLTVNIGLTQGLKAKQVLFISKNTQADYDKVKSLDDFRETAKIGVFGTGWAATKYWDKNSLKYITIDGASNKMIKGMSEKGNRGFDYFSRGVLSASKILKQIPTLELEKNLLIEFDDDFILYLNKDETELRDALQSAIAKAQENGHMDKLLQKHFPDTFDVNIINFYNRTRIKLD